MACLQMYLRRRAIEMDFKKMKQLLGLEDVRVMSFKKIQNILSIVHFIVLVSQEAYLKVMEAKTETEKIIKDMYLVFCHYRCLTPNPCSFVRFIEESLMPLYCIKLTKRTLALHCEKRDLKRTKLGSI